MTRLSITNGTPVYGAVIEAGHVAEIVIADPGGAVILHLGLATLGHLLAEGQRCMDQARALADARQHEQRRHCVEVGTRCNS